MDILVIGGTQFVGRYLVEAALQRGHRLTLFHRGQTNPGLFSETEHLLGDREHDLQLLAGRRWDAVIDTCGYTPRAVRAAAERLSSAVDRYLFVSTIAVFADFSQPGLKEDAPLGKLPDGASQEFTPENYGPLKALCEGVVERVFGERGLLIRPGLIVGPHDPTDRFTYWVQRIARGGQVLAPGDPDRRVQFIDARDLAGWSLNRLEAGDGGAYNATGPVQPLTMGEMLKTCARVSASAPEIVWAAEDFLLSNGIEPWSELPLWLPGPEDQGLLQVDCSKALAAGLTFRPLTDTVADVLAWDQGRPPGLERQAGLDPAREAEILQAWHARA